MSSVFDRTRRLMLMLATLPFPAAPSLAADHITADQVRSVIATVPAGKADLSGKDMSHTDLSGLDMSGANLAGADLSGANLHGVKLVGANLAGADLSKADLTFTWIMRANFSHARMRGATLKTVVTSTGLDNTADQAAIFVGTDLSDASITMNFSFDDLRGASFVHAHMTADMRNQSMGLLRTAFVSTNLAGADFTGAGLGHVTFRFAKLDDARFTGADLNSADFDGAYLTGADFTGANVQGATFESTRLDGVTGLDQSAIARSAR